MEECNVLGDSSGLTLVEILIVLVLSTLLIGTVYVSSQAHSRSSNEQHKVMVMQQDLRAVMDIIERDVLNTGCDPKRVNNSPNDVFGIKDAQSGLLKVTFDLDSDGVLDNGGSVAEINREEVTYKLVDSNLMRESGCLASNIKDLRFTYLDADGNTTASIPSIRSVEIELDAERKDSDVTFKRHLSRRLKFRNEGY